MVNRRHSEATTRFEERRRREDDAPRLRDAVPKLRTLRLDLEEYRHGGTHPMVRHTRHVVIDRAAALFVIPCGERDCDGVHDITRDVLRMLERSTEEFQGMHDCDGLRHQVTCNHRLSYLAHASYRAD